MTVGHRLLFNFSSSYLGGGLKRLHEFARWFDAHGGAWFIVHPRCRDLRDRFPANRYFVVSQPRVRRLYADCAYLPGICAQIGRPELYYAYGMPIYERVADVNWFHLSNVLTVYRDRVPLSLKDRATFGYLGWQIRRHQCHADVIAAESECSLERIRADDPAKLFLSVNGSDDELAFAAVPAGPRDAIAVVVGTYRYKALEDAWRVFDMLRSQEAGLQLVVIGREQWIPRALRHRDGVLVTDQLPRDQVVGYLRRARYYISTTRIENSYNAASEGLFLSAESYLSDIGPHRELLRHTPQERVTVPGMREPVIHVRKTDAVPDALKSWNQVITGVLAHAADVRAGHSIIGDRA